MSELGANISGVMTGLLLLMFLGICLWSWSSRRSDAFEQMSQLPLEDDDIQDYAHAQHPQAKKNQNSKETSL